MGRKFELSLVFVDDKFSRHLNSLYRKKKTPANVLSFLISQKTPTHAGTGEIFIDLITAKKEMEQFDMSFDQFITYLFIHGLLHLKGMRHGDTMERTEKKLLHGAPHHSRH